MYISNYIKTMYKTFVHITKNISLGYCNAILFQTDHVHPNVYFKNEITMDPRTKAVYCWPPPRRSYKFFI